MNAKKTQQLSEVVYSFNLWRSFIISSYEEMSGKVSGNILPSSLCPLNENTPSFLLMLWESSKIKKFGSLDTIVALLHQGLMSCVCKNINYGVTKQIEILGYFGEKITFGLPQCDI